MTTSTYTTIKASDKELNTTAFETEAGGSILSKLGFANVEGTSVEFNGSYLAMHETSIDTNQFLLMVHIAFDQHKSIVITPDNIWLLICQGFAQHIKENTQKFRNHIYGRSEKTTISVRRDDFVLGRHNPWEEVFPEFTKGVNEYIGDKIYNNTVLQFSTSTLRETTAFEIAFMDAMSVYFDYSFVSLCGIPEIRLAGSKDDYLKMINALDFLNGYDLKWWTSHVVPILEQFIAAFDGKADYGFWNSIYKLNSFSGGPYISGWITRLFPYTQSHIAKETRDDGWFSKLMSKVSRGEEPEPYTRCKDFETEYYRNTFANIRDEHVYKMGHFPNGISKVPFKWQYLNKKLDMHFISGFIGIRETDNVLSSEINWVVARDK